MNAERRSILFCFCGPTASGKSTICRELLKRDALKVPSQPHDGLRLSISTTTRKPREDEVESQDYYFVGEDEFQKRIEQGLFIEHAQFSGNHYGTERRNVDEALDQGFDLLLDIEVQGVQKLKYLFPDDVITTFVFPPSFEVLVERLRARAAEDEAQIKKRLETAKKEIEILSNTEFSQYLLLNNDLSKTVDLAQNIVSSERSRLGRFRAAYLDRIVSYQF